MTDEQRAAVLQRWVYDYSPSPNMGLTRPEAMSAILAFENAFAGATALTQVNGAAVRSDLATRDPATNSKITDTVLDNLFFAFVPVWKASL